MIHIRHRRLRGARRLLIAATALLAATSLAGCSLFSGASASGGNDKVEKSRITVGVLPIMVFAGFEIARDKGFFKEEGLDVDEKIINSGATSLASVQNGSMDITGGNWVSFIQAQEKKAADLKFISESYLEAPGTSVLATMPGSGINGPKDLAGRTVGLNVQGGNVELTARAVLQANGVDPNTVHFVTVPVANYLQALQTRQVDAVSLVEPQLTQAKEKLGAVIVADRASGPLSSFPTGGFATSAEFLRKYPRTVAAFQRAMNKAQEVAAKDRKAVEEAIEVHDKVDRETAQLCVIGQFPSGVNVTRLQRVADLMQAYNMLQSKFDVTPLIYQSPSS